jgi:hypothetical protein
MANEALLTVKRGHNIGKAIIQYLTDNDLYKKVNVLSFNFVRNTQEKTIKVTITYKYDLTNNQKQHRTNELN